MNDYFYPMLFQSRKEDILIEEFKVVVEILGTLPCSIMSVCDNSNTHNRF
jgi:hypothetical protein